MPNAFAISVEKKSSLIGMPALLVTALAFTFPVKVANYDFRHFTIDEGMTVSFSRSSPPLAALEDEHLPIIKTEPVNELTVEKNAKIIGSGSVAAWQRLQKFAFAYERRHHLITMVAKNRPARHVTPIVQNTKVPFSRNILKFHAHNAMKQEDFPKLSKVSELTKLLTPVKNETADTLHAMSREVAGAQQASRQSVREFVEAPLNGQEVTRSLPRGEDTPPVVIPVVTPKDQVPETSAKEVARDPASSEEVLVSDRPLPLGPWKAAKVTPAKNYIASNHIPLGPVTPTAPLPSSPAAPVLPTVADGPPAENLLKAAQPTSPANRIVGQVELTGGLAVTGQSTQLEVAWKSGLETKQAMIDYSTGQFYVDVPTLASGKLIARVTDESKRVLGEAIYDLDEASTPPEQHLLEGLKLVIEPKETSVKGRVRSAYSVDSLFVAAKDAEVFGPNGARVATDSQGLFSIDGINSDSTLVEEGYAPDHWGTRIFAEGGKASAFPVFPQKMLQSFFDLIGQSSGNTELGVIWGQVKHRGKPQAGAQIKLPTPSEGIGPFYFNALQIPDKNLTATSSNGLFAFVKVKPGLHLLFAQYNGRALPSSIISAAPAMVSYTEISFKSAVLRGHVEDPISQKFLPAQISVVGSSQTTMAGNRGFEMRVASSDPITFVEANPGPDYLVSREAVPRSKAGNIDIYAFKKTWLASELNAVGMSQDQAKGIFVGFVAGPVFHVSLDGDADREYSEDNVGYFGSDGHLEQGRIEGVSGGGAFILTNLSPGLHTLIITSAEGEMTTTRLFVAEAGVVNVTHVSLRP